MAENRKVRLITKRTSVPGKIPTGTTGNELNFIQAGELASNLSDHSLWGYDGTDVFEYGSNSFLNQTGGTISGDLEVSDSVSANTFFSGATELSEIIDNQIELGLSALTSSYFDAYDILGGTTTTTTAWSATVPLNSQRQNGNDFTHSTITNNDEVTIASKSKYLVIGRTSAVVSVGSARSQAQCRLEVDSGSGFIEVSGTIAEMYLRLAGMGASGNFQAVLDLDVGDKLRITFRRELGTDQVTLQPGGSSLSIMKVLNGQKGDKGTTGDLNLNGFDDFYVSGTTYSNVFSGNTQEAVFYGDGSNLTGLAMGDIHYMIWAEENGNLSNNNRQWSFGNGSVGVDNVYVMYDSEITKMFLHAESPGTTATIDLMVNDIAVATALFNSNGVYTFPSPITIFENDMVGFRTNTVTGTWNDVRTGVAVKNELSGIKGDKGDKGDSGDTINVQGGTNIFTSGTSAAPIINLENDISLSSVFATNLSGDTFYSGSTELSTLFGEVNTVSNVGSDIGIFKQKSGVDFEFHSLSGTNGVTVGLVGDIIVIKNEEEFYIEKEGQATNSTDVDEEYFTNTEGGVIDNIVTVEGGLYEIHISFVYGNSSNNGDVQITPQIDGVDLFPQRLDVEPDHGANIYYGNIHKRVTLSAGDRDLELQLSNQGNGTASIYSAYITLKKIRD